MTGLVYLNNGYSDTGSDEFGTDDGRLVYADLHAKYECSD